MVTKSPKEPYIIYEWSLSSMDLYFDTLLGLFYMHDATYTYYFGSLNDSRIIEYNCTNLNQTSPYGYQFSCIVNEWFYGVLTLGMTFTPG